MLEFGFPKEKKHVNLNDFPSRVIENKRRSFRNTDRIVWKDEWEEEDENLMEVDNDEQDNPIYDDDENYQDDTFFDDEDDNTSFYDNDDDNYSDEDYNSPAYEESTPEENYFDQLDHNSIDWSNFDFGTMKY